MTSISAVARLANVSPSTVSRYLRGELRVSAETENRIVRAMTASGYQRARNELERVGLIIPELANPYFAELTTALHNHLLSHAIQTHIAVSNGTSDRERALLKDFSQGGMVDALVFATMSADPSVLEVLPMNFPIVFVDEHLQHSLTSASYVGAANFQGAYQATKYLLRLGHRTIAHIGGPPRLHSAPQRRDGFLTAMREEGLPEENAPVITGPYTEAFGSSILAEILKLHPAPTAVLTGSDVVAIGLYSAAELLDVNIPEQLSIFGFDGISIGDWLTPRLSSVVQPVDEIADRVRAHLEAAFSGQPLPDERVAMRLQVAASIANEATKSATRL